MSSILKNLKIFLSRKQFYIFILLFFLSSLSALLEILSSTGLQVKTDPGIPLIYSGAFFLMISTLISYITYSQVWMLKKNQQLFIGGNTNRALFEFEIEFLKFVKEN